MIKTIIFDFDGVLIDSESKSVKDNVNFLKDNGIVEPDLKEIKALIGTTDVDNYIYMAKILNISLDEAKAMQKQYEKEHPYKGKELVFPEVVPFLQYLKRKGFITAIASNSLLTFVQQMLKEAEITNYFDYVISGREFGTVKPDPTIYLHTAKQCHTEPVECLVIEDSPIGIQAGINAGMKVVGIYNSFLQLDVSKADYIVNNLLEIKDVIEKEFVYD